MRSAFYGSMATAPASCPIDRPPGGENIPGPKNQFPTRSILAGVLAIVTLATSPDGIAAGPTAATPDVGRMTVDGDPLRPNALYNRIGRPIPVVLSLRGRTEVPEDGFDLVLLAPDGTVLASAIGGAAGEFDLLEALPAIADLTTTA
ncbi:MAG TPA: hypothetical protein DCG14_01730, partial [Phycisphaerales bacterium]|nr:hypothetical protein [Phycisphaerales bacterium]